MIKEDKILLPEEVRRILNADNKEIVDLCKQTSVLPKKNREGQLYFSLDEVKRLKRAKENKTSVTNAIVAAKGDSQVVVDNLLSTLKSLENSLASSVEKVIDDKLEGIDAERLSAKDDRQADRRRRRNRSFFSKH